MPTSTSNGTRRRAGRRIRGSSAIVSVTLPAVPRPGTIRRGLQKWQSLRRFPGKYKAFAHRHFGGHGCRIDLQGFLKIGERIFGRFGIAVAHTRTVDGLVVRWVPLQHLSVPLQSLVVML